MNKKEFIEKLREKLSKLPQKEVEDRISFYGEMIDDKIEDGVSEQEAVAEIGSVDRIASQIATEIPLSAIVKENVKPKRKLSTWAIALIILGSPVWISLLASIFAVIVSVYASIWAGVASLWAGFVSLCAGAVYGIVVGGVTMIIGDTFTNLVLFGMGIACVGVAILFYFGCWYTTKGVIIQQKKLLW